MWSDAWPPAENHDDNAGQQESLNLIERYRREELPLIVPETLLSHFVSKYDEPYLAMQTYLGPHARELQLRNHV